MKQKLSLLGLGVLMIALATTTPADAANKEHQQLMADIRMLQEQSQVLQNLLGQLNDTLKGVNTRLDQQTEASRKSMADQKLVIDNLSNDVRVVREKLDDNNVRLGSLSQEVDALRQAVQQCIARPTAPAPEPADAAATPAATAGPPASPTVVASPTQMWDTAWADSTSRQYDLAVLGFDAYIKTFPKKVKFKITQGGAQIGVNDVAAGRVTIGDVSRDPLAADPAGLVFYPIAKYGICVITNKSNPVPNLTQAQVISIFTGKTRAWTGLPGATANGPMSPQSSVRAQ